MDSNKTKKFEEICLNYTNVPKKESSKYDIKRSEE